MRVRAALLSLLAVVVGLGVAFPRVAAADTAAPPAASLRWRVGYLNRGFQGDDPAAVSVYASGQIIVVDRSAPYGYLTGQLEKDVMDELSAAAASIDPAADYGETWVSDVGDTVVTLGGETARVVSVWGLTFTDGLEPEQQAARQRLQAFVDGLTRAADDVRATAEAYAPDQVDVQLLQAPDDGAPAAMPWPLAAFPDALARPRAGGWCLSARRSDVPVPSGDPMVWATPADVPAVPTTVGVEITAQLPDAGPCEDAPMETGGRPLGTDAAAAGLDWPSPWTTGERSTPPPLAAWFAEEVLLDEVLPQELPGGTWDRTRWSWFDVHVVGTEVDGMRYLDVHATCTDYVTDEEDACTIDARLDPATGDLVGFAAR